MTVKLNGNFAKRIYPKIFLIPKNKKIENDRKKLSLKFTHRRFCTPSMCVEFIRNSQQSCTRALRKWDPSSGSHQRISEPSVGRGTRPLGRHPFGEVVS